jgi:hypothetical protein
MDVAFLLLDSELAMLRTIDPDRDWRYLITGERAWILQAYLRLRARGLPVSLCERPPSQGIVVFSAKQRRQLRTLARDTAEVIWVGVREDVGEALIADFELVQNPSQADEQRRFFMPHWPQPALIPREASRGTRIENIGFKGFAANLASDFSGERWQAYLRQRQLGWFTDAVSYTRDARELQALAWNDYRNLDVVLAVRPDDPKLHPRKPATKLYNAWHAGVPALLGPEIAYRAMRRSELDYIEVRTAAEAQAAIERLIEQPELYRAMVESGLRRGKEITSETLADRWSELLFHVIPQRAGDAQVRYWQGKSLRTKELARRAARAVGMWK